MEIKNEAQAKQILSELEGGDFVITDIKKGVKKKTPAPPFITSTLQQEASRRLGFQAKRTMKAAQELYEGIDLPKLGAVGLITYMRTDSLRISDEAVQGAREYITGKYGEQYLPEKPRVYKKKSNTQDAHEAIRPTMPSMTPEQVKASLTLDQYKLYKLIWERFTASQMADALLDTVSASIDCGDYTFKASGYSVRFDGFTALYEESKDVPEEKSPALPELLQGEKLKVNQLDPNQHFTQPPARYTEATIIKALEENGIGRPSTYAPTLTTVIQRGYVERDGKSLVPTQLGEVTNDLMENEFSSIVNVDFTAQMETDLDRVEEGTTDWVQTLREFYGEFEKNLEDAEKKMGSTRLEVPDQVLRPAHGHQGWPLRQVFGLPGLSRVQKYQEDCAGNAGRLPGVRRQNPRQKVQKGQDLFWLRAQSPVPVYDLGQTDRRKMPEMRLHPVPESRQGRQAALPERGLRI